MGVDLVAEIERELAALGKTTPSALKTTVVVPKAGAAALKAGVAKATGGLVSHSASGITFGTTGFVAGAQVTKCALPVLVAKALGLGLGIVPSWPLVVGAAGAIGGVALYDRFKAGLELAPTSPAGDDPGFKSTLEFAPASVAALYHRFRAGGKSTPATMAASNGRFKTGKISVSVAMAGFYDRFKAGLNFAPALMAVNIPAAYAVEDTPGFVDRQVGLALAAAETRRREMRSNLGAPVKRERRFSFRVKVPPGTMDVYWKERNGKIGRGLALDISFRSVHFHAPGLDVDSIERLEFPRLGKSLIVTKSTIVRKTKNGAVIHLYNFNNGVDGWMSWIEILTRIDQE